MGNTITGGTAASAGSATLISDLITDVRQLLRDPGANAYPAAQAVAAYNRTVDELQYLLMRLGAPVATAITTITGNGTSYEFSLPGDFLAFEPNGLRPRSPAAATSNYTHGSALANVGQQGDLLTRVPTTVTSPARFMVYASAGNQLVRFDAIPVSGDLYDGVYYQKQTAVTTTTYLTTYTPWLGLLDPLIKRTLELFLREGLEFSIDAREAWRQGAEADVQMLLGMRHLPARSQTPSSWRGLP